MSGVDPPFFTKRFPENGTLLTRNSRSAVAAFSSYARENPWPAPSMITSSALRLPAFCDSRYSSNARRA